MSGALATVGSDGGASRGGGTTAVVEASSRSGFRVYEATTRKEKERLYHFRYQVFTQEQHKYVAIADHENQWLVDDLDEVAIHLVLEKDGAIIGSLRQIRGLQHATPSQWLNMSLEEFRDRPEAVGFSGRLFVLPEHRGSRGLLHLLLANYHLGRSAGLIYDFILCNPHLVRFYEQMGYRRYRPYCYEQGLGFQIPLVLVADDQAHLQRVGSVFAAPSANWPSDTGNANWLRTRFPGASSFVSPAAQSPGEFAAHLSSRIHSSAVPLFEGLSGDEIGELIEFATHLRVEPGTRLVRRGDLGQELYIILDGVAETFAVSGNGEPSYLLATLGRGDTFGEMSVLTSKPRSSDVVAESALEVVFFDQATLNRLVKGRPSIAGRLFFNLSRILAERVDATAASLVAARSMTHRSTNQTSEPIQAAVNAAA